MLDKRQYEQELQRIREEQIDQIGDFLAHAMRLNASVREHPVSDAPDAEQIQEIMDIPISRTGRDPRAVADELVEKVLSKAMLLQHPRFFSFVISAVSPYALAGAVLADIYNPNTGGFSLAPGSVLIEEKLVRWMGSLAGFDENCGGLFTSGGSISNLAGCICARRIKLTEDEYPLGCAYISDQTHSSVRKGLTLMGLRRANIRVLPSDEDFRMRTDLLEEAIKADIAAGNKPFLIVATIGTTNTGSIDPLAEIAAIKEKYGMWMHVDGAYGGSILFSDIYRNLAAGIERADTLSWDTHKWAMQGYSSSTLIARNKKDLISTFAEHPEYLADIIDSEHTDGWDLGIEMSRPARALKLWCTVQSMGTDLLSDVIDYSFYNASTARAEISKHPIWEITSKPMCGTITFRCAPKDIDPARWDELNAEISRRIIADGYAYVVTTVVKNMRVLRLNLINGNTTTEDVIGTVDKLTEIAEAFCAEMK